MCCVALPCCLFDLACFFLPSFSSLIKTCTCISGNSLVFLHEGPPPNTSDCLLSRCVQCGRYWVWCSGCCWRERWPLRGRLTTASCSTSRTRRSSTTHCRARHKINTHTHTYSTPAISTRTKLEFTFLLASFPGLPPHARNVTSLAIFIACYVARVRGKAWERGYLFTRLSCLALSNIFGFDSAS